MSSTPYVLPSLESSPHLQWKAFFRALYLIARNAGIAYLPDNGCLHFILPDAMWWALPGNTIAIAGIPGIAGVAGVAAGGGAAAVPAVPAVAAIAAIPATPRPITAMDAINAGANQGQRDMAKANNLQHVELTTVGQNIRAAIFTAIGPVIQGRLVTDEETGNINLDTWEIVTLLKDWYGTLSAADVNGLLAQLDVSIDNVHCFPPEF